ncbi:hypothetical protein [Clostridium sp. UBA871]|uniref:hypothetical protein n=1 Tax=Clostridium sp. UBA871 TaxID=1946380 RepID=UPI00321644B6
MNNDKYLDKRNLPTRNISKNIYIFYNNTSNALQCLQHISRELFSIHSPWLLKCYSFDNSIAYKSILKEINTPYHKYDKALDKLCIIGMKNPLQIENTKIQIEHFSNIDLFQTWLLNYLDIS